MSHLFSVPHIRICIFSTFNVDSAAWPYCFNTWMGFAVRVRSAGQKYGPTCHQRDRADVTEFVTLVRLSSLGQHVGVLALAGYKRRKSALTAGPIVLYIDPRSPTYTKVSPAYAFTLVSLPCGPRKGCTCSLFALSYSEVSLTQINRAKESVVSVTMPISPI